MELVAPLTVVCLGEGMIELAGSGDAMCLGFGGDVMNTAIYLARRGCNAAFATALGDDPYSEDLILTLATEGVDTSHIARDPVRIPGLYLIRTDAAGEREFHYWRAESAARALFRSANFETFLADLEAVCGVLYVSGITLSLLDNRSATALVDFAAGVRGNGGAVVFDTNYRPRGWPSPDEARRAVENLAPHVSTALPTFEDEATLFGDASPEACAARWSSWGAREIVVKIGLDGAYYQSAEEKAWVAPPDRIAPVDTTGAGDSFNAGFMAARFAGEAAPAAVAAGNVLAGAVIRHRGAVIPRSAMPTDSQGERC